MAVVEVQSLSEYDLLSFALCQMFYMEQFGYIWGPRKQGEKYIQQNWKSRYWDAFTQFIQNNMNALFCGCCRWMFQDQWASVNYISRCTLQLLENDNHWDMILAVAIILTICYPTQSLILWEKYKNYMTAPNWTHQDPNIEYIPVIIITVDHGIVHSNFKLATWLLRYIIAWLPVRRH